MNKLFSLEILPFVSLWLVMFNVSNIQAENFTEDWLISSRFELIQYTNFDGVIRESDPESNQLYFSNIYLNIESELSQQSDFIIEIQAKTSDLYLLGGFVTIADSLEGIGSDEDEVLTAEQTRISELAIQHINTITDSTDDIKFERAHYDYQLNDNFGFKLGSVRIPFGFWDDYSLLRNLSAGKTDPIILGVQLRRTDIGGIIYGEIMDTSFHYEIAIVNGEEVFELEDRDDEKDGTLKIGARYKSIDFGVNSYFRNLSEIGDDYAIGIYYRYRMSRNFTLLGESVYMTNKDEELNTRFHYIQGVYDLGDRMLGLRWNFFLESYNSTLLKADLDDDVSYEFLGTHIQLSTGFIYAHSRSIESGIQYISGVDEEGDLISRITAKLDIRF